MIEIIQGVHSQLGCPFWLLLFALAAKVWTMRAMWVKAGRSRHLRGSRASAYWRNPKDASGDQKLAAWQALRHKPSPLYPETEMQVIILSEIEQRQRAMTLAITIQL